MATRRSRSIFYGRNKKSRSRPQFESLEARQMLAGDLIAHWRASDLQLDNGATVDTWTDTVSEIDARQSAGSPEFVQFGHGGRPAVRFDPSDGDDELRITSIANPLNNANDFSVTVAFAASETVGDGQNWFDHTGLVDASNLGFSTDWGIAINAAGQVSTGLGGGFGRPAHTVETSVSGLNDGQLHMATMTRAEGNLSIYVDDHAATSISNASDAARSASLDIVFGRLLSGSNPLSGDIAEVRLYNGQLSPEEVASTHVAISSFYNNQLPVANDDEYSGDEDTLIAASAALGVLANDTDADGDPITAEIVDQPAHGTIGFRDDGSFIYSPEANFFGTDTFTYRVSDFRPSDEIATVTITVRPQYDAPIPIDDTYKAIPTVPLTIPALVGVLQNDTNIDQAELTAVVESPPENGTLTLNRDGSFVYDPEGFAGTSTFTYRIDDGVGLSSPGTVSIVVNTPPDAASDTYVSPEDNVLETNGETGVLANDRDADGNELVAILVSPPETGEFEFLDDGSFTFTPVENFHGVESFQYRVSDGIDSSQVSKVTLEITSVNDLPLGSEDAYFALPDQPLDVTADAGVLANDFDVEGNLSARLIAPTANGDLVFNDDGSFSYTPNAGFLGTDSFRYELSDSFVTVGPISVEILITAQPVIISEIMSSNAETLETQLRDSVEDDFEGEVLTPDWIELRNLLSAPIDIGGLHLTNDSRTSTEWQFPPNTIVPGDGYLVVFASGLNIVDPQLDENGYLHTNFSLNTDGEYLALTSENGEIIDAFDPGYPAQRTHITYGADSANPENKGYFVTPTPGAANGELRIGIVADTKFDVDRGFFSEPFDVTITTETEGAAIRYTTDGTVPTLTNGMDYTGPINVAKTTTIRTAAFKDQMVSTNVDTASYFFVNDIVEQDRDSTIAAGFPERWGSNAVDYGLDSEEQFPRIAGDQDMSIEDAKQAIANSLMAIPSLSIVMNVDDMFGRTGIYTNAGSSGKRWERPTSVEMINPDGAEGFQIDAGIRIQGGAFRGFGLTRKKSFRLLFKTTYGPGKLNYPLFGPDASTSFDTLTLRMEANDGWQWNGAGGQPQYARDEFLRRVQLAMGQPASHGRAMHLYINGFYWGMYNVVERPDQSFGETYFDSNKYDWDGINSGSAINAEGDSFRSRRTRDAWNDLVRKTRDISRADTEEEADNMYMQLQGLNPDGTNNPEFEDLLDVENMIDYLIVNYYAHNSDWPFKNYYVGRENSPESTGFKFFTWDAEWSLFLRSNVNGNNVTDNRGVAVPFQNLRRYKEFQVTFGDRVHMQMFNDGPLYVDPDNPDWDPEHPERNVPAQIYLSYVDEIYDALLAESARWGDQHRSTPYTRDIEWQREFDRIMGSWFPRRTAVLLDIFKRLDLYPEIEAVTWNQRGGIISETPIELSAPAGTIYYTTDGSDPRRFGGAVNENAIEYTGPITVDGRTTIRARVFNGEDWSAIDSAEFSVGTTPASADSLRVVEVHYNPGPATDEEIEAGFSDKDEFEFLELLNISDQPIDLTNVQFQQIVVGNDTQGIAFDFANAAIKELGPGERLIVVENLDAFTFRYGNQLPVAGVWSGGLSNRSETITIGSDGDVFQQFAYRDTWYDQTDGRGFSLEIIDPAADNLDRWNDDDAWRASTVFGGTPGADSGPIPGDVNLDGVFDSGDLIIMFQAGEYEDGIPGNSTREEGDFDGDGDFTTSDLVLVFRAGFFQRPPAAVALNSAEFGDLNHRDNDDSRGLHIEKPLATSVKLSESNLFQREAELIASNVDAVFENSGETRTNASAIRDQHRADEDFS